MNQENPNDPKELKQILNNAPTGLLSAFKNNKIFAGAAIAIVVIILFLFIFGDSDKERKFITEKAHKGDLVVSVTATGTLEPTKSVDVGIEQSGTLEKVLVQENDVVKKGQLLAQLDLAKLNDAIIKSKAQLRAAEASVAQNKATVAEAKASLSRMRQVHKLSGGKVPSKTEMETTEANLLRAQANYQSALASVEQARAILKTDETNLTKGRVFSPVDGVVLSRKVEPGQTVAATMTTPILFTIAEDLTKMELQINVDEADISSVQLGQPATFTVAAHPKRKFPAKIQRVGIGSTITDNVVTYKTVLEVENEDLSLRPGMTATASIVTAERKNVLLVPNTALRFVFPKENANAPKKSPFSFGPPRQQKKVAVKNNLEGKQTVWIMENGKPRAITVEAGISNGKLTEVTGGELKEGMEVITDTQEVK